MSELKVVVDFPMTFTEKAKERLLDALKDEPEGTFVRIKISGGGCSGFQRLLEFDTTFDAEEDIEATLVFTQDQHTVLGSEPYSMIEAVEKKIRVVVDSMSALYLKGTTLDFITEKFKEGFSFSGNEKTTCGCGASVSY